MAGGGTGGHVVPSLAVAGELRAMGHEVLFVGTRRGMEATLVPRAGYGIEWIEIGGLQNVGWRQKLKTAAQLPLSVVKSLRVLRKSRAAAVFTMGGYVAAPVMTAAWMTGVPMVAMEPNAVPGLVMRKFAGVVRYALVGFDETLECFPRGRAEVTGLPVREAFFAAKYKGCGGAVRVLVTGGSRGSRTLNRAARESWAVFRERGPAVRMVLQCGADEYNELAAEFNETGLDGEVVAFIHDMAAAYAEADVVVSRSGAGAVNEIAASARPSILVPYPYAADDHQTMNALAMVEAGAAWMCQDAEMTGERLHKSVSEMAGQPELLRQMSGRARAMARPGAARRAAELLVECGRRA